MKGLKTSKLIGFLSVIMMGIFLATSCQKDLIGDLPIDQGPLPDLTTTVNSKISGFVTDENNEPVQGATVRAGGSTATTDEYGYFSFSNVSVVKNAATVSVSKAGYFKAIKSFTASDGKGAFFRIKMIPKNTAGAFSASSGGTVSLPSGMQVSFPANAIVTASNNTAYSGNVSVAASWIDPTSPELALIMPGDLRGLDEAGYMRLLTTYGMVAVELYGSSNELLQMAPGSKATVTFPLPASLTASAPASIPLWYFDEQLGLWKMEGSATRSGNSYVGEVSHFSYWNCDVPNNFVQFSCTVVNTSGQPVSQAFVKVSVVGSPYRAGYGWTDSAGYTGGAVPRNETLLLEIFSDQQCSTPAYSQTFTTGSTNVSLGTITITNNTYTANVTGTVTDCSNNPVTNGSVMVNINQRFYRFPVSNTGSFDFNLLMCSSSTSATLVAEDYTGGQQSSGLNTTLNSGANPVGNLQACGVNISQFINFTVNGTPYAFTAPADSVFQNQTSTTPGSQGISLFGFGGNQNYTQINFSSSGIAQGSTQNLEFFQTTYINDSTGFTPPILVNITEYGPAGTGFIAGNFTGTFLGSAPPPGGTYNVTCNFRVRRRF